MFYQVWQLLGWVSWSIFCLLTPSAEHLNLRSTGIDKFGNASRTSNRTSKSRSKFIYTSATIMKPGIIRSKYKEQTNETLRIHNIHSTVYKYRTIWKELSWEYGFNVSAKTRWFVSWRKCSFYTSGKFLNVLPSTEHVEFTYFKSILRNSLSPVW